MSAWPTEIRLLKDRRTLVVSFDDGQAWSLPAEYLRVESPSAEVQGHNPSEKRTVPGKKRVRIDRVDPVGNYAVRLVFDDGHSSGIYTWGELERLGHDQEQIWGAYLVALEKAGLSRER